MPVPQARFLAIRAAWVAILALSQSVPEKRHANYWAITAAWYAAVAISQAVPYNIAILEHEHQQATAKLNVLLSGLENN